MSKLGGFGKGPTAERDCRCRRGCRRTHIQPRSWLAPSTRQAARSKRKRQAQKPPVEEFCESSGRLPRSSLVHGPTNSALMMPRGRHEFKARTMSPAQDHGIVIGTRSSAQRALKRFSRRKDGALTGVAGPAYESESLGSDVNLSFNQLVDILKTTPYIQPHG